VIFLVVLPATVLLFSACKKSDDSDALPEPKRIVIPKLHGSVTVDGDLSEPVWKQAAVIKPFFDSDSGDRERGQTELRVWYDDTAIYLGWICTDADIQGTFVERDSPLWREEAVEFFITPKELTHYFEFEWNPLGAVFDATIDNDLDDQGVSNGFSDDTSYTAKNMRSAVMVKGTVNNSSDTDKLWQVEVMIPFADLGQPTPKPKDVWRGNFYRINRDRDQPTEFLSWSPTMLDGFQQPSRFGYIEFGK
jgi:cellulose/xylan binding protein with CBM9 domain